MYPGLFDCRRSRFLKDNVLQYEHNESAQFPETIGSYNGYGHGCAWAGFWGSQ